jgi:hypothetical protein
LVANDFWNKENNVGIPCEEDGGIFREVCFLTKTKTLMGSKLNGRRFWSVGAIEWFKVSGFGMWWVKWTEKTYLVLCHGEKKRERESNCLEHWESKSSQSEVD